MIPLTRFTLFASLAGAGLAAAQDLQITNPSTKSWWVAKSANILAWTCKNSPHDQFTVLVSNSNPSVLVSPITIIATQSNSECSKLITQDQSDQPASTGYRILLANPSNSSDIFAQSDEFEIKPPGSAYPSTSAPPGASTAGSGIVTSGSDTPVSGSSASSSNAVSPSDPVINSTIAASSSATIGSSPDAVTSSSDAAASSSASLQQNNQNDAASLKAVRFGVGTTIAISLAYLM